VNDPPPDRPLRRARVHRVPRYGIFTATGAVVGVLAAVVLTSLGTPGGYGYAAVLGYLAVALGLFGALLGALAGVLAAILGGRRR
jgi:hypothetical protein